MVVNMIHNRCLNCMADKGDAVVCPACGWREGIAAESPLYLKPGTVLDNRYTLGRVLGHGGFGITYLAWDQLLNVKLAIKEYMPREYGTRAHDHNTVVVFDGEAKTLFVYGLDKFLTEARLLAQFSHFTNIVSILNFFRANGTGYMVMEYVDGLTLQQYLDKHNNKLPFSQALQIMMPVMDALREVHSKNLLHRDISPDNIYLTETGQIKVLDFGAARYAMGSHSHSLALILKPGFSPEEQYRSQGNQGSWTDVYGAAATLYRMITGRVPPEALDRLEEDPLIPPSRLGATIPPAAETALLKGLAVKATDRFQSIQAFQNALMVNNKQEDPLPRIPPPPSPRPPWLWALLAVAALFVAGVIGLWFANQPDQGEQLRRQQDELARVAAEQELERLRLEQEKRQAELDRLRKLQMQEERSRQEQERLQAMIEQLRQEQAQREAQLRSQQEQQQREAQQEQERQRQEADSLRRSAESFVRSYYDDLNRNDASAAINKWSAPKEDRLRKLIGNTAWIRVNEVRVEYANTYSAEVYIDTVGKARDAANEQRWAGIINLTRGGDGWKIEKMNLSRR